MPFNDKIAYSLEELGTIYSTHVDWSVKKLQNEITLLKSQLTTAKEEGARSMIRIAAIDMGIFDFDHPIPANIQALEEQCMKLWRKQNGK